jgi:hypothetical protein
MGMNTGLQDAYNLAWKLALVVRGVAKEALLDSYEAERVPVVKDLLLGTGISTKALARINHPVGRLLRWAAKNVNVAPLVDRLTFGAVGMTDVAYPSSPLNCLEAAGHGWLGRDCHVSPGSRAPDSAVTTVAGEAMTLQHFFIGTRFVALLFPAAEAAEVGPACPDLGPACATALALAAEVASALVAPVVVVQSRAALDAAEAAAAPDCRVAWDHTGAAREEYGARPEAACLALVRPDGHVCLVQEPASAASLQAYLAARVLL